MNAAELEDLRQNSPFKETIDLCLRDFTNETLRECITVVQQNVIADTCWIKFGEVDANLDIEPLIALLQSRLPLRDISLSTREAAMLPFDNTNLQRCLQAIAGRRHSIESLSLRDVCVPIAELVSIINRHGEHTHNGWGLKTLSLAGTCDFVPTPKCNMEQLEAAFQRNPTLRCIKLCGITAPCFSKSRRLLAATNSVRQLEFDYCDDDEVSVGLLVQAASSVKEVKFDSVYFGGSISRGLAANKNLERVVLQCYCRADSVEHFRNLVVEHSHIKSLAIQTHAEYSDLPDLPELTSLVLGRSSSIRDLEISYTYGSNELQDQFTQDQFEEMLLLLENDSQLQKLTIGVINSPEMVSALARSVPKMKLEELHIHLHPDLFHVKPVLMAAFEKNTSLFVIFDCGFESNPDLFDADDYAKLGKYSARNRFLRDWLANPNSIPLNLFPAAAARVCAETDDYTALFHSLRYNVGDIVEAYQLYLQSPSARVNALEAENSRLRDHITRLQQNNRMQQERIETQEHTIHELSSQVASFRAERTLDDDRVSKRRRT